MSKSVDSIHLAFGFDELMELPFLVLAHSIGRRLKRRKAVFHVLHTQPLKYCATFFDRFASPFCEFRFYEVTNPFADMRMRNGVTAAAYLRFLLPDLLPEIERVVWIDCDAIVLRDICELYETNLEGFALAAVLNYPTAAVDPQHGWTLGEHPNDRPADVYLQQIVELSDWTSYFNSGVLVMDLDQFRRRDLIGKCREFILGTEDTRIHNDQDSLNHAVDGAFKRLDLRWNVQASRKPGDFAAEGPVAAAARRWQSEPWILHYTGPCKPWIGNMAGTRWDHDYWREAVSSPVIAELIDFYLATCAREQLTHLFSPRDLLARGKPKLDADAIRRCARSFAGIPDVSSAMSSLVERLDSWPGPTAIFIPSGRFRQRGGLSQGDTVAFDLADSDGHIIFGPHAWLPSGTYDALFEFRLDGGADNSAGKVVIEVVADGSGFKAQRTIDAGGDPGDRTRTLTFGVEESELSIEFRIFASGYTHGTLWFSGVRLLSREPVPQSGGRGRMLRRLFGRDWTSTLPRWRKSIQDADAMLFALIASRGIPKTVVAELGRRIKRVILTSNVEDPASLAAMLDTVGADDLVVQHNMCVHNKAIAPLGCAKLFVFRAEGRRGVNFGYRSDARAFCGIEAASCRGEISILFINNVPSSADTPVYLEGAARSPSACGFVKTSDRLFGSYPTPAGFDFAGPSTGFVTLSLFLAERRRLSRGQQHPPFEILLWGFTDASDAELWGGHNWSFERQFVEAHRHELSVFERASAASVADVQP